MRRYDGPNRFDQPDWADREPPRPVRAAYRTSMRGPGYDRGHDRYNEVNFDLRSRENVWNAVRAPPTYDEATISSRNASNVSTPQPDVDERCRPRSRTPAPLPSSRRRPSATITRPRRRGLAWSIDKTVSTVNPTNPDKDTYEQDKTGIWE